VSVITGLLQRLLLYLLLVQLGTMSLGWNMIAWLLHPLLPRHTGTRVGRAAISRIYRIFWATAGRLGMLHIDAAALAALRDEPGGLIIAANHPTMLDALLVIARVPRGICIMRSSLMRNPFLGAGARLARYIRNEPPRGMIRSAVENLKAGGQLVLFPEGERSIDGTVRTFKKGAAILSDTLGVPIVPVALDGVYDLWPRNRPINWRVLRPWRRLRVSLEVGTPLAPAGPPDPAAPRDYAVTTGRLRTTVEEMWNRLRERRTEVRSS